MGLRLAKAVPEHCGTESPHNEASNTTNDLISLQVQSEGFNLALVCKLLQF